MNSISKLYKIFIYTFSVVVMIYGTAILFGIAPVPVNYAVGLMYIAWGVLAIAFNNHYN